MMETWPIVLCGYPANLEVTTGTYVMSYGKLFLDEQESPNKYTNS